MIKNHLTHKRTPSEAFKFQKNTNLAQTKEKKKKLKDKSKSKTISLVEKSSKKTDKKRVVVEKLNQCDLQNSDRRFFAFGQNVGHKEWNLDMDRISEVQDSGSRRELTSHRSQFTYSDKENQNVSNFDQKIFQKKKKSKRENHQEKSKKINKNQHDKSAISLSRVKQNSHRSIEHRTEKVEKGLKMLWECVGELWQNTRVSQYRSEKNGEKIEDLKRCVEDQNEKILQIKNILVKNEKSMTSLRC